MELHTNSHAINSAFQRLLAQYPQFSFVSAWAGIGFGTSDLVLSNIKKAHRIVVGTHFYQTHPRFIDKVRSNRRVKFILEAKGVFHPKMYMFFKNETEWTLLVGSANFTKSAFTRNSETFIEVCSIEQNIDERIKLFNDSYNYIEKCWANAAYITEEEYFDYVGKWRSTRWFRNKLEESKGNDIDDNLKLTWFQKLDWHSYIKELYKHKQKISSRIELLQYAHDGFVNKLKFGDWEDADKLLIGGVSSSGLPGIYKYWALLGNTSRQANFGLYLRQRASIVCQSLDIIPLNEPIEREHYNDFRKEFKKVYGNASITSASRLLTLKRPDVFYCYTKANRNRFSEYFNISPTTVTLDNYWERVVLKIRECNWYSFTSPNDSLEGQIVFARAAILDAIFYDG